MISTKFIFAFIILAFAAITVARPLPLDTEDLYERDFEYVELEDRQAAALAEPLFGAVVDGVKNTVGAITNGIKDDKEGRSKFTQDLVGKLKQEDPNWNYVVDHTKHKFKPEGKEGKDWMKSTAKYDNKIGKDTKYDVYKFKEGTFDRKGDGGYLNWAYSGDLKNAKDITFTGNKHLEFAAPKDDKKSAPPAAQKAAVSGAQAQKAKAQPNSPQSAANSPNSNSKGSPQAKASNGKSKSTPNARSGSPAATKAQGSKPNAQSQAKPNAQKANTPQKAPAPAQKSQQKTPPPKAAAGKKK